MKTILKISKYLFLFGFLLLNVISYNHAYKFTHFAESNTPKSGKPEYLPFTEKLKVVFWGISNPKPVNYHKPARTHETINIQSKENLEAWLVSPENPKGIVLLFHGYSGSKSGMINYAEEFYQKGYRTFLVDFQGSGGSTGHQTTIGFEESKDVEVSYNYIKNRFPEEELILFGSSMGAAAILKSVAETEIKPDKLIVECPFGSMRTTTQKRFEAMGLPTFILPDLLMIYGSIQNGFNAYAHNPTEYARGVDIPTLLLYGAKDPRVTRAETDAIFQNLKGEKSLSIFPHAGHENYLWRNAGEWKQEIDAFLTN
jgi:alpha-beta hydrolase superfamily lysophospholipase